MLPWRNRSASEATAYRSETSSRQTWPHSSRRLPWRLPWWWSGGWGFTRMRACLRLRNHFGFQRQTCVWNQAMYSAFRRLPSCWHHVTSEICWTWKTSQSQFCSNTSEYHQLSITMFNTQFVPSTAITAWVRFVPCAAGRFWLNSGKRAWITP